MQRVFNNELTFKVTFDNEFSSEELQNIEKVEHQMKIILKNNFSNNIKIEKFNKVGIQYFIQKLKNNENFSFIKFGDGELLCMLGAKGENCDFHPYSEKLSKLLQNAFAKLFKHPNVFLADWKDNLIDVRDQYINLYGLKPKFADYDCFLTVNDNLKNDNLLNFYSELKKTKRKKIFVGPEKLLNLNEMLNLDEFVNVPIVNAFSKYEEIKKIVTKNVDDNNLYIFCCSMMSCVLCNDLVEKNNNITMLDIGSGFDPIFSEKTRPKQPTMEECHKYFRSIIPEKIIRKKLDIATSILSNHSSLV